MLRLEKFGLHKQIGKPERSVHIGKVDLSNKEFPVEIEIQVLPTLYVAICSEKRAIVGVIPADSPSSEYDKSALEVFLGEANQYLDPPKTDDSSKEGDSSQGHSLIIVRTCAPFAVNALHWDAFFHHIAMQRNKDKIEVILHDPVIGDADAPLRHGLEISKTRDYIEFHFERQSVTTFLNRNLDGGDFTRCSYKTLTYGKRDPGIIIPSVEDGKTGTQHSFSGIFREQRIPVLLNDKTTRLITSHLCMDGSLEREIVTLDDVVYVVAGPKSCVFRVPIEWTIDEIRDSLGKIEESCFASISPAEKEHAMVCCYHPIFLSEDGKKRGTDRANAIRDTTKPWVGEAMWAKYEYQIENIYFISLEWSTPPGDFPRFMPSRFNFT